jgi:Myb-like DNA-binding domain
MATPPAPGSLARGRNDAMNSTVLLRENITISLLQKAVDANRTLQHTLQGELLLVTEVIYQNRTQTARFTNQLLLQSTPKTTKSIKKNNSLIRYSSKMRRWSKRFFVDYKGSEPEPNVDTLRRRKSEQQSFFYHIQPPWSSKEAVQLMNCIQNLLNTNGPEIHQDKKRCVAGESELTSVSSLVDFDIVAMILNQQRRQQYYNVDGTEKIKGIESMAVIPYHQRTQEECRIQHEYLLKRQNTRNLFNNQKELRVLSNSVTSMVSSVGTNNINWDNVAEEVTITMQQLQKDYCCAGWECLMAYHTKLKSPLVPLQTSSSVWTIREDELLLKFLAAAGPQAVIDSKNILLQHTLCTQLLRNKSKKQIFSRVNQSLLNPSTIHSEWTDYEERRLPICMKVYFSTNHQDSNQVYCASTHCVGRSTKSVVDKWNRSINPLYSTRPFTEEEDKALLQAMRSSLARNNQAAGTTSVDAHHIGWTELSQKYFANRHPQRLQNRWSELATDQDIINRERAKLLMLSYGGANDSGDKDQSKPRQKRKRRQS